MTFNRTIVELKLNYQGFVGYQFDTLLIEPLWN